MQGEKTGFKENTQNKHSHSSLNENIWYVMGSEK